MTKKILTSFLIWKLVLAVIIFAATFFLPLRREFTFIYPLHRPGAGYDIGLDPPYYLWLWGNFDGYHYISIAQDGYHNFDFGFFPLYPIMINVVHQFFHVSFLVAAQIISNLAIICSLFVIRLLLKTDGREKLFSLLLLVILFFPTSFFYTAAYNDSLFFLLALVTIYFSRRGKWFLSGIVGALATLTRLNGLALFFFIVVEYFIQSKKSFSFKKMPKNGVLSAALIPLAFLSYLFYLKQKFGGQNSLFSSMKIWNQDRIVFPLQVVWRYTKIFFIASPHQLIYWIAVLEFLFVIVYCLLILFSFRKIRFSYWIFFAISILIPSLTGTFQGMPRYGLHLYPFFLSLAIFLSNKNAWKQGIYLIISFLLLFFYLSLFARGYFVA